MYLPETRNRDISHAHECVVNALFEIPLVHGVVFSVEQDQRYLAAMVRQQHIRRAAEELNRGDCAPDTLIELQVA